METDGLAPPVRRLAEELDEAGIALDGPDPRCVAAELDQARRVPSFEGQRPTYGSIVLPDDDIGAWADDVALVDVTHLDLDEARTYADGRSAWLVHAGERRLVACFDRNLVFEADLVELQERSGAEVVQRTPVLGAVRLIGAGRVVSWDGRDWRSRPTTSSMLPTLQAMLPDLDDEVARGALDLALHWLSPARTGASLVLHTREVDHAALDMATARPVPALNLVDARHRAAVYAALRSTDLATLVLPDGTVSHIGVGLRASKATGGAPSAFAGMRHRSAERYAADHPDVALVVVSEDGPVTLFHHDAPTVATAPGGPADG